MTSSSSTSYLMCSMTTLSRTLYLMCSMATSSSTSSFPSLMSSMSCKSKKPKKSAPKKEEKNWGWQLSSWQMFFFWGWVCLIPQGNQQKINKSTGISTATQDHPWILQLSDLMMRVRDRAKLCTIWEILCLLCPCNCQTCITFDFCLDLITKRANKQLGC